MADHQQFVVALHDTLAASLGLGQAIPDTAVIKKASSDLQDKFYKQDAAVPALFEILLGNAQDQVRQLAAVECRKRVGIKNGQKWLKLPVDQRKRVKEQLLQSLTDESNSLLSHALARLAGAVAKVELPSNAWPELLPWLWRAASAPVATTRERSLYTLFSILETVIVDHDAPGGPSFSQHTPQLFQLLSGSLADPESLQVRLISMRCLGQIASYIEPDEQDYIKAFQDVVPGVVQVIQQALEAGNEEGCKQGFEIIETVSSLEVPLIQPHLTALCSFLISTAQNEQYDEDLRMPALSSLLWVVKYRKSKIQSLGLARPILEGLLPVGGQDEPEDIDTDSPARIAFRVIDALANVLPPAHVVDPLINLCQQYSSSPDPRMRKSAVMAFGVVFEGCSLYIAPHLEQLWPFIEKSLQDPESIVRKAACIALGFMCEMLGEDCGKRHATLLPLIFDLINDPATQKTALNALDSLLEVLGSAILPYLPTLMDRLLALLSQAPLELKGTIVGAIGSAAHAAKTDFAPYFRATMDGLQPFLVLTEEDEHELRGITQDTVGTLADAVGPDAFRPYFAPLMKLAMEGASLESPSLRECSYIFFSVISRVYKAELAPYLTDIMALIIASLKQSELGEDELDETEGAATNGVGITRQAQALLDAAEADAGEDGFVDIDEDGSDAFDNMGVYTAIGIEKEVAADAIGSIFENTREHFMPYIQPSVLALLPLLEHAYEGIRKSAACSLVSFIATAYEMTNPPKWEPGVGSAPLHERVQQLSNAVIGPVLAMWAEEEERTNVSSLCEALSAMLLTTGPQPILPDPTETICQRLHEIIERKALCQTLDADPEDDEAAQDVSEWDAALIRSAEELVGTLASVLGNDFSQAFGTFLPALVKYYNGTTQASERSSVVGSLAEVSNGLQAGVTPYTQPFYDLFIAALLDQNLDLRSNAAYAIGCLVLHSRADLSAAYSIILQRLQPLFQLDDMSADANQARDNASGSVARLILKNAAALPMDQVLPVLFSAMPLREDFRENEKLFEAFQMLVQTQNPALTPHISQLLQIISQVLSAQETASEDEKPLTQEGYTRVVEIVRRLPAQQAQAAGLGALLA
ncbi:uncharacterized protein L969DRAFT_277116 [Mixia osmundae IAM 14324]|uniref:Importin N-terminal domain-containing protein n=1 Tax=Mixia osmundae (strain CBS 9802 / IAM 14324 / JCM 22182 / KY 12970) TaxID=764103 RepID=G7E4J4_MIXOS|nr:uncharacterized protein L969DRAFT_277116 [Mixia osmundae IAM 14324]KEI36229.1 hypothetical protein L969DRAFT_277116 [Mixia osmundae IAM 14324]GAA97754.1 hypothetical protein E5Q_04433 [Mixia osmundae IAM 14324]